MVGPTPAGDPPVPSSAGVDTAAGPRRLGFSSTDLNGLVLVPDDPAALASVVEQSGHPFNGAFVPLVIHEPTLAERSYDAGEWAADLIRSAGGRSLVVAPYAHPEWAADGRPSARQWNHTVAMVERLQAVCQRFAALLVVRETIGGGPSAGAGPDLEPPVHHLLDAGNYVTDGFVPVRLVRPERPGPVGTDEEDPWTNP